MFVEILFPQKVGKDKEILTYKIPENLTAEPGQICEVPLRNQKKKGVIAEIHQNEPSYKTKTIFGIMEHAPHLGTWQMDLIKWMADYYFCPLFKVLKLFFPVSLIKKKTLNSWMGEEFSNEELKIRHELNSEQQEVLRRFKESQKRVALLHGVTASGKTEIYLHLADQELAQGRQVLMLIPEISLTPQTLQRFQDHFNQKIAVIHSQLTAKEKEQEWMSVYKQEAKIIIGSRSALFAPFQNLGLIIIDEEHEPSYKQDQSPRYNTVDVALQMAKLLKIKVLLGSATPSLESYYQTSLGNFDLLELTKRAQEDKSLPETNIIDLREEFKKKNFSIFSELLQQKLKEKLANQEQTILFLNRRGAASAVICRSCGYVVKCQNCDLPMTYHKKITVEEGIFNAERLICHHCGKMEQVPHTCPNCQSPYIRYIGLGTQRVEEELQKEFSKARIIRADRDTVKKRNQFKIIYNSFKNHEADILIGTQMIALGLHLPKVNLVGVILADLSLTIPNFRSSERTFQLITQVAGRAGRGENLGEVIIQTYLPNHYAILKAAAHDYKGFYEAELELRKGLNYPPFSKLIKLTICDKNPQKAHDLSKKLFTNLQELDSTKENQITHYPSFIPKLKNIYRWHILMNGQDPSKLLKKAIGFIKANNENESIKIDVDPISTV
jgi:primosomal protein N' (replication factor Y)